MTRERAAVLYAAVVGVCAALGVGVASRAVVGQPLDASVSGGVQAGLVAALVFLGAAYVRRTVL